MYLSIFGAYLMDPHQ